MDKTDFGFVLIQKGNTRKPLKVVSPVITYFKHCTDPAIIKMINITSFIISSRNGNSKREKVLFLNKWLFCVIIVYCVYKGM
jgi:hypothetical protein